MNFWFWAALFGIFLEKILTIEKINIAIEVQYKREEMTFASKIDKTSDDMLNAKATFVSQFEYASTPYLPYINLIRKFLIN